MHEHMLPLRALSDALADHHDGPDDLLPVSVVHTLLCLGLGAHMGYGGSRPLLSILRLTPRRKTCSRSTDGACYTRGHMIAKELDGFAPQNRFEEAGQRAEEQMAFYLRREFGDDASVVVVNDLRLERQDGHGQTDAAQIDHVVVHPGGLVLVESKSVMSKVRCDEHGHWARHTGRYY